MKTSNFLLLVIVVTLLTGCQLVVDIPVPYDGDKVVVNGIQKNDSVWQVDLSRSMNILSPIRNHYFELPDAEAFVYHPDGNVEKLQKVKFGVYRGNTTPIPGENYKIIVNSTGFESVSAEMVMPRIVPIVDVKWDSTEVKPPNDNPYFTYSNVPFALTVNDPAGEKNFYAIKVYQWQKRRYGNPGMEVIDTLVTQQYMQMDDPGLVSEDDSFRAIFSDEIFNGKSYSIKAWTQFQEGPQQQIFRIDVWLVNLSEDSFRYEESVKLQQDVSGDPFAQPVQVFSNIKGGLGIFAGNAIAVKTYTRKVDY